MIKIYILSTLLLLSSYINFAQINPSSAPELFQEYSTMSRVDILIDTDSLLKLNSELESSHEYNVKFVFNNSSGIKDTLDNIGFKLRGNGSRSNTRKSYSVSFNAFESGRKYYGFEQVNLKATNDVSLIRPKLCWYMCREMGIPAVWISHVQLYAGGEFYGVYSLIEHIDDEYVERQFGNKTGNLYKCRYPSDLNYEGNNPETYKKDSIYYNDRVLRVYDLKTNKEEDDYTDLMLLTDTLNNTPMNQLADAMKNNFNMDQLLRFFALEVYMGHWDSYSGNGNNYYLYNNPTTNKFEYLTTDLDLTLGIMYGQDSRSTTNIYNWFGDIATYNGGEKRPPLRHRILQVNEFRDKYTFYLKQLINTLPPDSIRKQAEIIQDYVYPFASSYSGFNYSKQEFEQMLDDANNSDYGVIEYLEHSYSAIKSELDNSEINPIISNVSFISHNSGNVFKVTCTTENEGSLNSFRLYYSTDGISYNYKETSATSNGKLWGQKHHEFEFVINEKNCEVSFYLQAIDNVGTSNSPEAGEYKMYLNLDIPELYINEFMASNDYSITDEYGERDDWIEIYNAGTSKVTLSNLYLTDKLDDSTKWKLPNIDIEANDFAVFWTDKDEEQGESHANFKLSADGETIYLFDKRDSGVILLVDSLQYGYSIKNSSYGRVTDGTNELNLLNHITPKHANDTRGLAYAVFEVDMAKKMETGYFYDDANNVNIAGIFNNWNGSIPFANPDIDKDSTYLFTQFSLTEGSQINYRFRINEDGAIIDSTNIHEYTLAEGCNNIYHVYKTSDGSSDISINGNDKLGQLTIFPNPANNIVYISSDSDIKQYQVISMNGKIVINGSYGNSSLLNIDISTLPTGVFIVKVITVDDMEYYRKLIKN